MSEIYKELYQIACTRAKRERDKYLALNGINYRLESALLQIAEGDVPAEQLREFAMEALRDSEKSRP